MEVSDVLSEALTQLETQTAAPPQQKVEQIPQIVRRLMQLREDKVYKATSKGVSDFCHPANQQFSYENYLVGIEHNKANEFNFIMKNTGASQVPFSAGEKKIQMIFPSDSVIRKVVVVHCPTSNVTGFEFLTNEKVLKVYGMKDYTRKDVILNEGERIVGVKSRLHALGHAYHNSLILVIGRLE